MSLRDSRRSKATHTKMRPLTTMPPIRDKMLFPITTEIAFGARPPIASCTFWPKYSEGPWHATSISSILRHFELHDRKAAPRPVGVGRRRRRVLRRSRIACAVSIRGPSGRGYPCESRAVHCCAASFGTLSIAFIRKFQSSEALRYNSHAIRTRILRLKDFSCACVVFCLPT
jgi:hypothetical protein